MSSLILNVAVLVLSLLLAFIFFLFILPKRKKKARETREENSLESSGASIVLWLFVVPGLIFLVVNYFLPLPPLLHSVLAYILITSLALNILSLLFNLPKNIKNEVINILLIFNVILPITLAVITGFSAAGHALLTKPPKPVVKSEPPKKIVMVEQFPSTEIAATKQAIKNRFEARFDSLNKGKYFRFPIQPLFFLMKKEMRTAPSI